MNKQKKIFHRQEDKLPSTEDIFDYLKEEIVPDDFGVRSSAPSAKKRSLDSLDEHYAEEKEETPVPVTRSYSSAKNHNEKEEQANRKKYEMEKTMLSDPLVSEAVEGYSFFQDPKKAQSILAEINRNIHVQSGSKANNPVLLKIAAMFLGLLMVSGLIVYLYDQLSGDSVIVRENKDAGRHSDSLLQKQSSSDSLDSRLAIEGGEVEEERKGPGATFPTYSDAYIDPKAGSHTETHTRTEAVQQKEVKSELFSGSPAFAVKDTVGGIKESLNTPAMSEKEVNFSEALSEKKEEEKAKRSRQKELYDQDDTGGNRMQEGIQWYQQGKYTEARTALTEVLSEQPFNQDALFYAAMSDYRLKQHEAALSGLVKILPANSRYEEARWNMAQVYIELGKKEEAMAVWKELAARKGSYARRAKGKLKEYSK